MYELEGQSQYGIQISFPDNVWDKMSDEEKERANTYFESNTGSYVAKNGLVVYTMNLETLAEYLYFVRIMKIKYNSK